LFRGIRLQLDSLLSGLSDKDLKAMKLGLSHSLCRYKLKFSPDKVDTMIVQAISLLDELDKELNTYAMRVREWYGWHFPEMGKLIADNIIFARIVKKMGVRKNASKTDLSDILPEEQEQEVKEQAEISMGTEILPEDIDNIQQLCDQVINISQYRTELYNYLKNRMQAIAPNLTVMVGELVGARLIAHAGSLLNLAKSPASTVQILGAEKALFRALKTKHDTPKYGLIYHASLVGQATPKNKGKISRVLAAKTALCIRMDALGETEGLSIGLGHRAKVEQRMAQIEGGNVKRLSGTGKTKAREEKYAKPSKVPVYNESADIVVKSEPGVAVEEEKEKKKKKKEKKEAAEEVPADKVEGGEEEKVKKKKKRQLEEAPAAPVVAPVPTQEEPKKKKKKKVPDAEPVAEEP
jgi:nucleolar protein 58